MAADNFLFSRDIRPGFAEIYSGAPIESYEPMTVRAAFRQASEMYQTWCGRFAGNLSVYLLFMLPGWLYNIVASLVFCFYIFILQICVFGASWREGVSGGWILALAGMLWLGIPSFGEAFFWLSVGGQIALLGQALIFLPFRYALDGEPAELSAWRRVLSGALAFALGVVVASLDYPTAAVLPLTGGVCAAFLYFRAKRPARRVPWTPLCAALGLCLGAWLTLTAPGNSARLALTADRSVLAWQSASWPGRIADYLLALPGGVLMQYVPLTLLAWGVWVIYKARRAGARANWPIAGLLFFIPALLTYAAYLFTAWPPPRAFATPAAQLICCASIVFVAAEKIADWRDLAKFRILRALFVCVCLCALVYQAANFYYLDGLIAEREKIVRSSGGGVATVPQIPFKADRYWPLWLVADATPDPDYWVNRAMAAHYGVDKIVVADEPREYSPCSGVGPRLLLSGGRLRADGDATDTLRVYYYGDRAVLSRLPPELGRVVSRWLGAAEPGDWRLKLVPLLLARADILASSDAGGRDGVSGRLRVNDDDNLWIVKPGEGTYSFDLERLCSKKN